MKNFLCLTNMLCALLGAAVILVPLESAKAAGMYMSVDFFTSSNGSGNLTFQYDSVTDAPSNLVPSLSRLVSFGWWAEVSVINHINCSTSSVQSLFVSLNPDGSFAEAFVGLGGVHTDVQAQSSNLGIIFDVAPTVINIKAGQFTDGQFTEQRQVVLFNPPPPTFLPPSSPQVFTYKVGCGDQIYGGSGPCGTASIAPVPISLAMGFLGSGLIGLLSLRRMFRIVAPIRRLSR